MSRSSSLTDIAGVEVGHWTDAGARTGCTVVTLPVPNVGAAEVRGAYPATREFAPLGADMNTSTVDAVVFAGGSSFGLAAADGIMAPIEAAGRKANNIETYLPTVVSAVVYDLAVGDAGVRPTAANGRAAYDARSRVPVTSGAVGAGTGATVAKWRGPDETSAGGIGSHSIGVGDATVGVLVVVNAVGDVSSLEGMPLTGGPHEPALGPAVPFEARRNTTLALLATDAALDRPGLQRLLVRLHDAFGACLRPAHTRWDGDAGVAISCGDATAHPDALGEAAFVATARAIERAVTVS